MAATDRIKVLVLGDSGVGKTSLVHLICHNQVVSNAPWTIGASIEVKLHEYHEGTPDQRTCFMELWDVGGSKSHFTARQILYQGFHGIILVHDLTNRKSHGNLRKWLSEVFFRRDFSGVPGGNGGGIKGGIMGGINAFMGTPPSFDEIDFDPESFAGKSIPVLVIGTKVDHVNGQPAYTSSNRRSRTSSIAQECGAEEIMVDCTSTRSFAPASTNAVHLSRFLDKVIERKYDAFNRLPAALASERQRKQVSSSSSSYFIPSKFSHLD